MRSDAPCVIETAVLDQLRELDLSLLEIKQAGPEDMAREIPRRHWTQWQLEEPEVAKLMALPHGDLPIRYSHGTVRLHYRASDT